MERHTLAAGNVITEAVDTAGGQFPVGNWGVGVNTQSSPSAVVRRNLIFKALSATASGVAGIQLFNNGATFSGVVEHNVVYNWRNALLVNTPGNGPGSVIVRNNQFHTLSDTGAGDQRSATVQSAMSYRDNTYSAGTRTGTANRISSFQTLSQWNTRTGETGAVYALPTGFPDPNRDISGYAWLQGVGATFEDFIAAARAMDKTNWNPAFTAARVNPWLWQGFDTAGPPVALVADYNADALPLSIDVQFSEDVGSSLVPGDLTVLNLQTGQPAAVSALRYSPASAIARLTLAGGPLPDGNYRLVLPAGAVADPSGTPSSAPFVFDFFAFAGDANRDRRIDIADFSTLAANFNTVGPPSRGDADYSGIIDIGDFSILASRFNTQLPAARPAPALAPSSGASIFSSRRLPIVGVIEELD
jgi:hypothetical protein